ncbi:MAG: hypothetical protein Q9219_004504 [cf. Caloplaca sp. 3 TL-2023]
MVSASPYDLIESAPPKWRPQEDRIASAFVGISFFLFLETFFEIFRVFKKRRGLYFWALVVGVVATVTNNIAIVLKFLVSGSEPIWPLYTLMALTSWTCYSLVVWPAWNPTDPVMTRRWSPSDAIVERFTQLGFTLAETIVSGIYIHALLWLLKDKPTVRQRRVFLDLVYVNVITIALDITSTILVYLNQTGVSHPIQIFSYILKFRLEFVVLNQLMAVAARGLRRETFGEKRYHNSSMVDTSYLDTNFQVSELIEHPQESCDSLRKPENGEQEEGATEITVPAPVLEEVRSRSKSDPHNSEESFLPLQGIRSRPREPAISGKNPGDWGGARSVHAKRRRKSSSRTADDDDDDDEIPLHMWERNGELVMPILVRQFPTFSAGDTEREAGNGEGRGAESKLRQSTPAIAQELIDIPLALDPEEELKAEGFLHPTGQLLVILEEEEAALLNAEAGFDDAGKRNGKPISGDDAGGRKDAA